MDEKGMTESPSASSPAKIFLHQGLIAALMFPVYHRAINYQDLYVKVCYKSWL